MGNNNNIKQFHDSYEWMNESFVLCFLIVSCYTPKALTIMWVVVVGGFSPQPPPVCSIYLDDAMAVTGQRHQCHHTPVQVERRRESHRAIKCTLSPHTSYRWRRERVIRAIKCTRSPHTSYRWRRESHRANQVYALTTHQLQVERMRRDIEPIKYVLTTHQLQVERRERHRANQVYALTTTPATGGGWERVIETIKCMLSPHTSYRWRGERDIEIIQVYTLTTHQLQVERREKAFIEPIKCMRSPTHQLTCGGERERGVIEPIKCNCAPPHTS